MRRSLHPGGQRLPIKVEPEEEEAPVEEKVFDPEAAAVEDNPFPEEMVSEETTEVEETLPDYSSMTAEELRALCRAKGLKVAGNKADLIERLYTAEAPSEEAAETVEDAPSEEAASVEENTEEGEVSEFGGKTTEETG
tara:strand:+ start:911 stop:1324 length:414 start_codon:yes stop_codon:yes gene_type:complete